MGDVYKDCCDLPCCREKNYPTPRLEKVMKKDMVEAKKPDDVPTGPHFVIIKYVDVSSHDGWSEKEGGGYYTQKMAEHWVTEDQSVWEAEISRLVNTRPTYGDSPKFVAFKVAGLAKVERKVSVTVQE